MEIFTPREYSSPMIDATASTVRPATRADAADVARIYNHYVRETAVTFEEEAVPADVIAERIDKNTIAWLVATKDAYGDLMFYAMLGVILGGRIGYLLIYSHEWLRDPLMVLKVWEGGMSFHGGLVGTATYRGCDELRMELSKWPK